MREPGRCYNQFKRKSKKQTFIDQEYWHECVNGGKTITPHFGVKVVNEQTKEITTLTYEEKEHAII